MEPTESASSFKTLSLEWRDEYCVGHNQIDTQHQELFRLANLVFTTSDAHDLAKAIIELFRYVRVHFNQEEGLMAFLKYPGLQAHKQLHETLLNRLNQVAVENRHDPKLLQKQLRILMLDWVLVHILEDDRKIINAAN